MKSSLKSIQSGNAKASALALSLIAAIAAMPFASANMDRPEVDPPFEKRHLNTSGHRAAASRAPLRPATEAFGVGGLIDITTGTTISSRVDLSAMADGYNIADGATLTLQTTGSFSMTCTNTSSNPNRGGAALFSFEDITFDGNGSIHAKNNVAGGQTGGLGPSEHYLNGGGAIFTGSLGSVNFAGNHREILFQSNTTVNYGGAIYSENSVRFSGSNGRIEFSNNAATSISSGGAIFAFRGDVVFSGAAQQVIFDNNKAYYTGGAIQANDASLSFTGTYGEITFSRNSTGNPFSYGGGAICANGVRFGGVAGAILFASNTSATATGAIYSSADVVFDGRADSITFRDNTANGNSVSPSGGGAIKANNNLVFSGTYGNILFENNHSDDYAGAITARSGTVVLSGSARNVEFRNNTAAGNGQDGGGAIHTVTGRSSILINGHYDNLLFSGNAATGTSGYGGAIVTFNNINLNTTGNVLFANNRAGYGGAIYIIGYYSGTSSIIANGGDVTFRDNYHRIGTEWESPNAIYIRAHSGTHTLVLAATGTNHVYFHDPIASGTRTVDIAINPDAAHTGAVTFSGTDNASAIDARTTVHHGLFELTGGATYGKAREYAPDATFTVAATGTFRSAGTGTNTLDVAAVSLDPGARIQIDDGSTLLIDSDTFALTDGVTLATGTGADNALLLSDIAAPLSLSGSVTMEVAAGGTFAPRQSLATTNAAGATLAKTGDGLLILASDNSAFSGRLAIDAGTVQISSANNLGNAALNGTGVLAIDNAGDFHFSATHAAGDFGGAVRLQNQSGIALDNTATATRDILSRATLELAAGGKASTVHGQDYTLGELNLSGGLLDLATNEFRPDGLLTTNTLAITSGTVALRNLAGSGSLPTASFADRDFLSQSTVIGDDAILLVAADALVGDHTQIAVTDGSGMPLGDSYTIDYDGIVTATYETVALTGTKASTNETGLFLGANLTELDIHTDKTLELRTDNLAADSDRTLAARLTGNGNLLIDGTPVDGEPNYIILSHADNNHTGITAIATGNELRGGNHDIIASSSTLVLQDGAVFDTGAYNQALRSLAGSGTLRISDSAATLTFAGDADSVSSAAVVGSGQLVKNGLAGLTLGDIATTGTTAINAGSLTAASISGPVVNHAMLEVTGNLGSGLHNTGTARIQGSITGNVVNTGLVDELKNVAGTVENTGRLQLAAGGATITGALTGAGGIVRFRNLGETLALGALSGSQTFANLEVDLFAAAVDTIRIDGNATGNHTVQLVRAPGSGDPVNPDMLVIPVIFTGGGDADFDANTIDFGMYSYKLVRGDSSEALSDPNAWYLTGDGQSDMADDILSTAAILSAEWHYSLDSLRLRLGELHTASAPSTGNIWLRTNGYRVNASPKITGAAFEQDTWGVTAGADKAFNTAVLGGALYAGGFVQMSHASRDYEDHDGSSTTGGIGVGAYFTWLTNSGWYLDAVLKFDRYKNDLDVQHATGTPVTAGYNNYAQGLSLEAGRRINFLAATSRQSVRFWVEPMAQAAIAWLDGADYSASDRTLVDIDSATACQYRFQLRAGADIGDWMPYLKVAEVKSETGGGAIHAGGETRTPDFDGWRFETGAGIAYLVDERSQLYFDYEYNKSDSYERPWALNLGYRRVW